LRCIVDSVGSRLESFSSITKLLLCW
jgi:hypothetical protein